MKSEISDPDMACVMKIDTLDPRVKNKVNIRISWISDIRISTRYLISGIYRYKYPDMLSLQIDDSEIYNVYSGTLTLPEESLKKNNAKYIYIRNTRYPVYIYILLDITR